jgi:hypothetical protein
MVKVFKAYQEAYCSCLNCTGEIQQTARNQCIVGQKNQDVAKSVKSFKLRWPVRDHVMFDGMLINNHLRLPSSSPLSPRSSSAPHHPLLSHLLAPTSWMSSGQCSLLSPTCYVSAAPRARQDLGKTSKLKSSSFNVEFKALQVVSQALPNM